jgi:hypothetical protein
VFVDKHSAHSLRLTEIQMSSEVRKLGLFFEPVLKRSALLCAALLGLCTLAAYPFAEMGQCDDFSYVRSAKTLAETGHIVYYGWASAMLGWQLALGALFIKIFGFSFATAYFSVLLVALATAYLLQRSFVLLGLREANATFATLTLVLSPLFIPLSFSFMSDIPGFFAIVVCLYLCLRAVETPLPSRTSAWLMAASISSALLGTVRQTSWLGLFVMVPSVWWLVRKRRPAVTGLAIVWFLCGSFVLGSMYWFSRQMYSTVESFSQEGTDQSYFINAAVLVICVLLEAAFFLIPILIAFVFPFVKKNRRLLYLSLVGALIFCTYFVMRPDSYWLGRLLEPTLNSGGNYVTSHGTLDLPDIGNRPVVLQPAARVFITLICDLAAFAFAVVLITRNRYPPTPDFQSHPTRLSLRQTLFLLGPFTLAYCTFLLFRIFSNVIFDRYLLPLLMVIAVFAMRFYQDRVSPRLPRTCYAVLFLFAAYGIASTHDKFAEDRARLAAINQFRAAGLPRTSFYGGFPYDGWTQIDAQGYVDSDGIRTPDGIRHYTAARSKFKPCGYFHAKYYSAIRPEYLISYDDFTCGDPQSTFAPVNYRLWLPPFSATIYSRHVNTEQFLQAENEK